MSYKKSVDTLRVLIGTHQTLVGSARLNDIIGELNRIPTSARFPRRSGWLLAVLHTTRALDTTLSEVVKNKGWWNSRQQSLGAYLMTLKNNAVLTQTERNHYQHNVVSMRNTYMHQAGAIPSKIDADVLLAEMHACVANVLRNVLSRTPKLRLIL